MLPSCATTELLWHQSVGKAASTLSHPALVWGGGASVGPESAYLFAELLQGFEHVSTCSHLAVSSLCHVVLCWLL